LNEINNFLKEKNRDILRSMNDIIRKINDVVWHTLNIDTKFNFIDIIKGVVPLTFLDKIQKIVGNRNDTKIIIYNYRQKFVSKVNYFWRQRCDKVKKKDKKLGINRKMLEKNKGLENYKVNRQLSAIPKIEGLIGVRNHIYFGGKPLGFIVYMDLLNLVRCSLA
jgi:hypothetical protein